MKVLVVGGQLQGVEIVYLAKKTGWDVALVDRAAGPLARQLCDKFICMDVADMDTRFLSEFDLVFPAIENDEALRACALLCEEAQVPFAFDACAYSISSSKAKTNRFLAECGVATPPSFDALDEGTSWPDGYIVKPDSESGSVGVMRFSALEEAREALRENPSYVGQVFLDGAVLSIEVVCNRSRVRPYIVTEVVVGDDFDCYRIVAPAVVNDSEKRAIDEMALRIGGALDMRGIFDIEFVMHENVPYVLEIDARFPSQTPIAVFHATGVNLFEEVARVFCNKRANPNPDNAPSAQHHAILQHVRVACAEKDVEVIGECQLKHARPFEYANDAFGAEAMLTSRVIEDDVLVATIVVAGDSREKAETKLTEIMHRIEME